MKIRKNKMLGGGGVDRALSTSNNKKQKNANSLYLSNNKQEQCDIVESNYQYKKEIVTKNKLNANLKEKRERKLHELLTIDFARYNRANNGDKMNINFNYNFKNIKNGKTEQENIYNKVGINSKIKATCKKQHSILQSTVLLLSWLFVFVISTMFVYFANQKDDFKIYDENIFAAGIAPQDSNNDGIYEISSASNLLFLSTTTDTTWLGRSYKQTEDITIGDATWTPIGNDTNAFTGSFDGQGFDIEFTNTNGVELSIVYENYEAYGGFFGYLLNGKIENVNINYLYGLKYPSSLYVNNKTGGIVGGVKDAQVSYCSISGLINITGGGGYLSWIGGLIGYLDNSSVEYCLNEASITINLGGSSTGYVGGIVAQSTGSNSTIKNCYNLNSIKCIMNAGQEYAGGIVGYSSGEIKNCYNSASLTSQRTRFSGGAIGGIVGNSTGQVSNCFNVYKDETATQLGWTSSLTGDVGGIVGDGTSTTSYYDSSIVFNNGTQNVNEGESVEDLNNELKNKNNYSKYFGTNWVFGDTWQIDSSGNLNGGFPFISAFVDVSSVTFNITTNLGVIFTISDDNGNVQQVFIDKGTQQQTFSLNLNVGQYKIAISTFYTTNIELLTANDNQVLSGKLLTLNVVGGEIIVTLNMQTYVGSNWIII